MTIRSTWIAVLLVVVLTRGEISIDLERTHTPNLLLVRSDGGNNNTMGECSTIRIRDIFPEPTMALHESKAFQGAKDAIYVWEPIVVTLYNTRLRQICERQRLKLWVTQSDKRIRLLSTCYNCSESDQRESIRYTSSLVSHSNSARLLSASDTAQVLAEVSMHSIWSVHAQQHDQESAIQIRIHEGEIFVSEGVGDRSRGLPDRIINRRQLRDGSKKAISNLPKFRSSRTESINDESFISSVGTLRVSAVSDSVIVSPTLSSESGNKTEVECSPIVQECCEDQDCTAANNICLDQTCIDEGFPRFTLSWSGDDDIDLYVVTPGGFVLSYNDQYDEVTQGRVGEPVVQNTMGQHVENVFFPLDGSATSGVYEVYVRPMITVGTADEWTLTVSDERGEVLKETGTRFSPTYTYVRSSSMTQTPSSIPVLEPTLPPLPKRTVSPLTDRPSTQTGSPSSEKTTSPAPTENSTTAPTYFPEFPNSATSTFAPTWIPGGDDFTAPPFPQPCTPLVDECCTDSDCLFSGEICFNRNCIDDGNPRFTLSWIGDDDLDLFVLTPLGKELSFMNFFDVSSGGRFGEEVDQFGTGYHVENVYFPETGAPYGDYQFFVRPLTTVDDRDVWNLTVADNGMTVLSQTGTGISARYSYFRQRPLPSLFPTVSPIQPTNLPTMLQDTNAPTEFNENSTSFPVESPSRPPLPAPEEPPSRSPQPSPEVPPTRPPQSETECNSFFDECCESTDCRSSRDVCEQRTCIRDGNPRFTLTWDGEDSLDLYVVTPDDIEISEDHTFDIFSGGRFEMSNNQGQFGQHVENVYFPLLGSPTGEFSYGVRSSEVGGFEDGWTLQVYDGGRLVESFTGEGTSDVFVYPRNSTVEGPQRPRPSPPRCSPISDECCVDLDCDNGNICVQRTCIADGNPRITLRWTGDDDLNLVVEEPNGVVLSVSNPVDPSTGGRFQANSNQSEFGFNVESVYFPSGSAEYGIYKYRVESITTRGVGADLWKVSVYEQGIVVDEYSGIGESREFIYDRTEGEQPSLPESPSPSPSPVATAPCSVSADQCCENSDCDGDQVCQNRNCVGNGSPRITLTWTGDDDFDLYVKTPYGDTISQNNRFDNKTLGVYDQNGLQSGYGHHVENVYFPSVSSPPGFYTAEVRLVTRRGGPDLWTLDFFDEGMQQSSQTGTGDLDEATYQRQPTVSPTAPGGPNPPPSSTNPGGPNAPIMPPSSPPSIKPVTERPPPGQSPTTGDRVCPHECCSDQDCDDPGDLCVQRKCIADGTPRFTLTWTGNDNLNLAVKTPGGATISHTKTTDPESGGVFEKDENQKVFGFHVENIVFPASGGPEGEYTYFVTSAKARGDSDRWAIRVFVNGNMVAWQTGTGNSQPFTYTYDTTGSLPSGAPNPRPPTTPAPVATRPPIPAPAPVDCQMDSDCQVAGEVCVQQMCIPDGNPRFTLEWSGNDDLDLLVENPNGVVISKNNPFDGASGGIFSEPGDQEEFGRYVENIYFALGPSGTYKYFVRSPRPRGQDDSWKVTVSVDGVAQAVQTGVGKSVKFEFEFDRDGLEPSTPTLAPVEPECSTNSECFIDRVCIKGFCVEDGNPLITLTWTGDDDLDLYVVTPGGVAISVSNVVDPISSGRFGDAGGTQSNFERHIENVYFPGTGPSGIYLVYVKSFVQRGSNDLWSLQARANEEKVLTESGTGDSDVFSFTFSGSGNPSGPPGSIPTVPPTAFNATCNIAFDDCCSTMDCFGNQVCTQKTCIDEGNPRFTLTWTGDDDLDLVVMTPVGTVVSFLNNFDETSGGKFGGTGDQFDFGEHVENVFFPLEGAPSGTYSYYVRSFLPKNGDDVWTVQVFVDGQLVNSTTGTGSSGALTYDYNGSASIAPFPVPSPSSIQPQPQVIPTIAPECNIQSEECCTDSQCITEIETCVQTQCIDLGNPRFTLTWTGDDDLDLIVETPLGTTISFVNPLDEQSGGIYGEVGTQYVFDTYVENIYFKGGPSGVAPSGTYKYSVASFLQRNSNDRWTVAVFVDNQEVDSQSGFGDSIEFTYNFEVASTGKRGDQMDTLSWCSLNNAECCKNSDCIKSQELCVQSTCIDRGNPRFTLTWTGDDDLDLTVVTPYGTTVAVESPSDPLSGGIFGEEGDQLAYGQHVENIFFPLSGSPSGTYTFLVSSYNEVDTPDRWTISVFVDDKPVLTKTGTRTSDFFIFEYMDGFNLDAVNMASPRIANNPATNIQSQSSHVLLECQPDKEECCSDSDCEAPMTVCVQRVCIDEGNPRFTLTWNGNDDYDLLVTPPIGNVISLRAPVDFESGGRLGEDGIQTLPGLHAENIYFPMDGGPLGVYRIQVQPFQIIDYEDTWTVSVYVNRKEVRSFSGTGESGELTYEYTDGGILRESDLLKNETAPIPPCELETSECCADQDCHDAASKCIQRTCIPLWANSSSIILTWFGDDDLDLSVTTPSGTEISYYTKKDPISGAYFETSNSTSNTGIGLFQSHSERVIVPQPSEDAFAAYGTFKYKVKSFTVVGSADAWTIQVFIHGQRVASKTGRGDSEEFTFEITNTSTSRMAPVPDAPTTSVETLSIPEESHVSVAATGRSGDPSVTLAAATINHCTDSVDCQDVANATCIEGRCVEGGALQFTLAWETGEDLILTVWTPDMVAYLSSRPEALHDNADYIAHWSVLDEEPFLRMQTLSFATVAPRGMYKFAVTTIANDGITGNWKVWIHQDGQVVFHTNREESASTFFGFNYQP